MTYSKIIAVMTFGILVVTGSLAGVVWAPHHARNDLMGTTASAASDADGYDLLILTPATWGPLLVELVDHKDTYGVSTVVVTLTDVYEGTYTPVQGRDDAERIKYFIKFALDTWSISYLLLVGGRQPALLGEPWLLPVRYSHIEDNVATLENRYISDLYYADIYDAEGHFSSWDTNGNNIFGEWRADQPADDLADLYPDVAVGRLPCRNAREVTDVVNKIIAYESTPADPAWFTQIVAVAGDTYTFNDYYEGEEVAQQVLVNMTEFTPITLYASDGSLQSWRDVVGTINQGCGFLFFAGHGSPTTRATHPPNDDSVWIYGLQNIHMPLLSNDDKLPVCVVGGCHNCMFNISITHSSWTFGLPVYESWGWRLTRHSGGGAIATLGCTGLGYGKEDKLDVKEGAGDYLNVLFFNAYGQHQQHVLGEAWQHAITSYLEAFPIDWSQESFHDTALDAKTVQEWVLLGDPSLRIGGYPG